MRAGVFLAGILGEDFVALEFALLPPVEKCRLLNTSMDVVPMDELQVRHRGRKFSIVSRPPLDRARL